MGSYVHGHWYVGTLRVDRIQILSRERGGAKMRTWNHESILQTINSSIGKNEKSNCVLPFQYIKDGMEKHQIDVISTTPLLLVEKKKKFSQLYYFFDKEFRSMEDRKSVV